MVDDMNIKGIVRRLVVAMTVSCRLTRSARPLEKAANASPSRATMNRASSTPGTPVATSTPMMAAMMKIIAAWIMDTTTAAMTCPRMMETRVTGVASILDSIPMSIIISRPNPEKAEPNSTVITTTPGAKNWR